MATLAESAEVDLIPVVDALPHPEQRAIWARCNPLKSEAGGFGRIEQAHGRREFGAHRGVVPGGSA